MTDGTIGGSPERDVLDHHYDGVWALMQMRNQMAGDAPWPEDSRSAAVVVMAATMGYLVNAIEARSADDGREFRRMLAEAAA